MRINILFVVLFCLMLSCKSDNKKVHDHLYNILGKKIEFTKSVSLDTNYVNVIHYIDSQDCLSCEISSLGIWKSYKNQLENNGINVVSVIKADTTLKGEVASIAKELNINYEFQFDVDSLFRDVNNLKTENRFVNVFTINKEREIIWIGFPLFSDETWKTFLKRLTK